VFWSRSAESIEKKQVAILAFAKKTQKSAQAIDSKDYDRESVVRGSNEQFYIASIIAKVIAESSGNLISFKIEVRLETPVRLMGPQS
jgi:hypothetical protein